MSDLESGPRTWSRLAAEAAGTFILVFGVVGTAVFGGDVGGIQSGYVWVAVALGLSVLIGAAAFGPVSGAHFNPAVTVGLAVARRFPWRAVPGYLIAQTLGALVASTALTRLLAGAPDVDDPAARVGAVSTGWGALSPGGYSLPSAFFIELIATCVFVWVVLGATAPGAPEGSAPVAIGLALTLVALVAIPISNGSFNPARSIATAVYGGGAVLGQLWLSVVAPLLGGVIAGLTARPLGLRASDPRVER